MIRPALVLILALAAPTAARAQRYTLTLDSRVQRVSFRGIERDSILAAEVVVGPSGGLETPDGYAVTCVPETTHCTFFRAGPIRLGAPLTTTADLNAWGFGLGGLSLHATARLGLDLGREDVWPGTDPALQLLEGYVEYATERFTGRLGRVVNRGRLGWDGYDGIHLAYTVPSVGLTAFGYGGFGLARGTALPVTSEALNPLDEFQPRKRQYLAGAAVEWQAGVGDARLDYQREIDGDTRNWVSERVALSGSVRPIAGWSLAGGADYDLARQWWGNADLTLSHSARRYGGSAGIRRYRPFFDLWTIWGVFSPLSYSAVNGSVWVTPLNGLTLRGRGERYWYPESEAETPLVTEETRGWRWNFGAGYAVTADLNLDAGYHTDFGPGAASRGFDAAAAYRITSGLTLSADGGRMKRPLEFRVEEPVLSWFGMALEYRLGDRLRVTAGATRYQEDRRRPDASTVDWSQTRLRLGASWLLGSDADRMLPPAVRREAGR
jgi:hypothetical protein